MANQSGSKPQCWQCTMETRTSPYTNTHTHTHTLGH